MKNKTLIFSIVLLLFEFNIFISCRQQKAEWQGTIEEIDGVTVVKNPKEPMYDEEIFEIQEELSIGVAEGAEEYMFQDAREVVAGNNDRVFVSDFRSVHVRVFDKFGNYITTVGRKGQGPGEFGQVTNIQITPENELLVHDRYTRRLSFFSLDGKYLRTVQLKEIQAGRVEVNSEDNYLVRTYDFEKGTLNAATEIKKYSPDLEFLGTIAKDKYRSAQVPFQPWMASKLLSSDSIVCGFPEAYEFHILDSEGNVIQRVSKDYVPVEISEEEKAIRHLAQSDELPSCFPAFQDFSVDEEGRIYAQTYERQADGDKFYYDVFESDGKYICKVRLNALPQYWKNRKMYTIEEDESGFQYVKRHKVTWKI
jgi:hypothetical protein